MIDSCKKVEFMKNQRYLLLALYLIVNAITNAYGKWMVIGKNQFMIKNLVCYR